MTTRAEKRQEEAARIGSTRPCEDDPHDQVTGVLLSDEIAFYAEKKGMIEPFLADNLKPAGYELTIGDEYFLSGEFRELYPKSEQEQERRVVIPPFQVAVLKTREIIRLPRYLIARWNIRVIHAYRGLLWVGGPQVDPGYCGFLFCPIYNLSDKPVTLETGEAIALIDFVKTSKFDKSKSKAYRFPPKRMALEEFGIADLRSALFTRAGEKIADFQERISNLEVRLFAFTTVAFAIFGIVVGLLGLMSKASSDNISISSGFFGAGRSPFAWRHF